jgi:membrane protein YdbS with pleckstrin-like domain
MVVIFSVPILPLWWNMHYILDENELIVKPGGFWGGTQIPYSSIKSVKETRSPLASVAMSLDRIEIKSEMTTVLISPQNKQNFLRLLEEKRKEANERLSCPI